MHTIFIGATQNANATAAFNLGNKGGNPASQTYADGDFEACHLNPGDKGRGLPLENGGVEAAK